MSIHAHFTQQEILTRKVGQTDLVFGISRFVYTILQVSVCSGYGLFQPG